MKTLFLAIPTLVIAFFILDGSVLCATPPDLMTQCTAEFGKVGVCISFATGKADTPTKDCCTTVDDIKTKHPVCLCYLIQQVHDGATQVKQLGIQESKLLQLPNSCQLKNASIAECPKLLGLPPNSPDNSIFAAPTKSGGSVPIANTTTTDAMPKNDTSMGFMHAPFPIAVIITIAMAVSVFQMGFSSMLCVGA